MRHPTVTHASRKDTDIVLKWDPSNSEDNASLGITDDVYLDGYKLNGTRLWRIDLGPNIRAGAHYTQFSVYDFDGDGKAEVACKTAPGTKDGQGNYLHTGPAANDDDSAVYRSASGYILTGPEYLTVFSGATGQELATIDYPVPRGVVNDWGDNYGNRVDRHNGVRVREGQQSGDGPSQHHPAAWLLHARDGVCVDLPEGDAGAELDLRQRDQFLQ